MMLSMFTGIVEKTVRVVGVADGPKFRRITLPRDAGWDDVRAGESIAINGVCLTVAELGNETLGFDVIQETLDKTNLGLLTKADEVHVERSLRIGDRIDGHFVQGHVDGTARLVEQVCDEREWRLTVQPPAELMKFIAPKGSVALDGVSLTVAKVDANTFEVALIPTTVQLTALANRAIGWPYNLETDIVSKTVVNWLERQEAR
jgi:riboflavin synthase